mmetsp:Transcript_82573/g.252347  ORF Transcript_82573/g.252347 Transcript_82573/m.252347 type:complete len:267 (-) Transcript_82573:48-848(-)
MLALNAPLSLMPANIISLSAGRVASISSTLICRNVSPCSCKSAWEGTTRFCRMCIWCASASSAMHQAREKMLNDESTAMTCSNMLSFAATNFIMSLNLLISQEMLSCFWGCKGSVLLKAFGNPQSQMPCTSPETLSLSPCGLPPHMLACWHTENAQIQYRVWLMPLNCSISFNAAGLRSNNCPKGLNSRSPKASVTTIATRSRKSAPQVWVTILSGYVIESFIILLEYAHDRLVTTSPTPFRPALPGITARRTTSLVKCLSGSNLG